LLASQTSHPDPLVVALREKARTGGPGLTDPRVVAAGDRWRAVDIVCTAGPSDRPYEERQPFASVSLVLSGTFTYRNERGPTLLSAGSLLLVDAQRPFECSHRHGEGDRCLSFQFETALLEEIVAGAGVSRLGFEQDRVPPLRILAPLLARAERAIDHPDAMEEIAFELAGAALELAGMMRRAGAPRAMQHAGRIASLLREIEKRSADPLSLGDLARAARLSPYHFLRTFKALTGVTPHQWLLRVRLREAARRLTATREAVTDIALDVGFEDLSNFVRSFHAEFGRPPLRYRQQNGEGRGRTRGGADTRPFPPAGATESEAT
jgi:AraC family transcriptional regulator